MTLAVYEKTAGDLVRQALRASNIVGAEMPIEAVDFQNGLTALNDVLVHWQSHGIHLWSETEATLPLNPKQNLYDLSTAHVFTDYEFTTVTADFSATDTSFTVDSTEGMAAGQNIGFELSDGTRWWGEIDTVPDSTTVTTTTGVSGDGESGMGVYAYTDRIDQPLRVLAARHGGSHDGEEIRAAQVSRQGYFEQPAKLTTGNVNEWYYARKIEGGKLYVWPVASSAKQVLRFTFIKPQFIPESQESNVYIPSEWFLPLKWAVAEELGVVYAIDPQRLQLVGMKAEKSLQEAKDNDVEVEAMSIQPG